MSFAALSTIIAVFENLITFTMEKWDLSRRDAMNPHHSMIFGT